MATGEFKMPERGQIALPAEARRRWDIEVVDLGGSLIVVPAGRGGIRAMLRTAIADAGDYPALAAEAAADDPDLA